MNTENVKLHKPKAMLIASVASMIDLFNKDNLNLLINLGYDVDVAANFKNGSITSQERVDEYRNELTDRGVDVYHVPIPRQIFMLKDIIRSYKFVKLLVDSNDYQIIHCHSPIGSVICRLACIKARKRKTVVIYTAHGFHFFKGASPISWLIYYPIEAICSRFTDILITINKEDYDRALKMRFPKVEYVPGIGIHTSDFLSNNVFDIRKEKRHELHIEDDDFVFMSTGQLSVRKNHEVVIRALGRIADKKVKYLIVGFGELEDKLRALTEELGIEKRVIFAGYRGDVKELLHAVDAFAFPSKQEGLPVALMEAMASGLPVVCSDIRGNADLVKDGEGGFLCKYDDVEGFSERMELLANSDMVAMGRTNIETMKNFDISVVNSTMERIYKEAQR